MTSEQRAAYVNAKTASMCCELEAMKAANSYRERRGESQAYSEEAFRELPLKFGLTENQLTDYCFREE